MPTDEPNEAALAALQEQLKKFDMPAAGEFSAERAEEIEKHAALVAEKEAGEAAQAAAFVPSPDPRAGMSERALAMAEGLAHGLPIELTQRIDLVRCDVSGDGCFATLTSDQPWWPMPGKPYTVRIANPEDIGEPCEGGREGVPVATSEGLHAFTALLASAYEKGVREGRAVGALPSDVPDVLTADSKNGIPNLDLATEGELKGLANQFGAGVGGHANPLHRAAEARRCYLVARRCGQPWQSHLAAYESEKSALPADMRWW